MSKTMKMLKVLLCAGSISFVFGAAIFDDVDNIRIDRILTLNLPEESFKEDFFKTQKESNCGSSNTDQNDIIGVSLTPEDFEAGQKINEIRYYQCIGRFVTFPLGQDAQYAKIRECVHTYHFPIVKDFAPAPGKDPIHTSGYFEGDIKDPKFIEGRNAIRDNHMKWPRGEVPYVIANYFNREERAIIARAMEEFHKRTCIRFRPRANEYDYVFFTRKDGCFSMIGRDGGLQFLSLGDGCMYVGIVIHELMHAIGFWHEQSRADRDDFVTIIWENIQEGQTHNFAKYTDGRLHHLGEHYDYGSIMHYGVYEFSRFQNSPTILPKQRHAYIGQRNGFSKTDIRKINKLYQCDSALKETCVDSDSQCRGWAELGECKKNPKWMLANCRRSCGQCSPQLALKIGIEEGNNTAANLLS